MLKFFILVVFGLSLLGFTNADKLFGPEKTSGVIVRDTDKNIDKGVQPSRSTAEPPSIFLEKNMTNLQNEESTILPGTELFNFIDDESAWYTIDDNVMGGVSRSAVQIMDPGVLSFSGIMSLENNGGFTSVRSEWKPTNLKNYNGVLLRVLGDGKMYRLRIRSTATGSEIAYNAIFKTDPGVWKLVYVPFEEMVPTFRGFIVDVGKLNPASIASFGLMLSDKQPGEFNLKVDWIRAISEQELEEF